MLKRIFRMKRTSERHSIAIMNSSGDKSVEWELDDAESLAEAERVFERIRREGGVVFRAQPDGESGGKIDQFDPHADMVAVPRIVGG
jgi:hypothetical protein